MTRRAFWIILGLGAALRLLLIWRAGLWYDENFTLLLSRLPLSRMLAATMGDVHPPLWYLLVWPLGQIPDLPAWVIRLPSALLSIGSLALMPRLMRALAIPPRPQLIAFVMMAILPMQIHYAQEGRMYALLEILVIVGVLAVLEMRPLQLGLAAAGLLYTQNYGAFYVAALGGLLLMVIHRQNVECRERMESDLFDDSLWTGQWSLALALVLVRNKYANTIRDLLRRWIRMIAALGLGVLAWLPWLPVILRQMKFIESNYWIFDMTPGAVLYTLFHLFWAISLQTPAGNFAGMIVTFGLLILAAWYLLIKRPASWLMIGWMATAPLVLAIIVSLIAQPLLIFRPLIGLTPFIYIACAFPLAAIPDLRGRLVAACFIVPVLILGLFGYYFYLPQQKGFDGNGNMQAAIAAIRAGWQPGDLILDGNAMGWVNITPYLDEPQYALPSCQLQFPGGISPATHDALAIQSRTLDQLPPYKRIWLVGVVSPMAPACEAERLDAITAGRPPYLVLAKSQFLYSALWLLEGIQ